MSDRHGFVTPDFERAKRKGVPEVILADGKTVEHAFQIARLFLVRNGRAILSRVSPELELRLRDEVGDSVEFCLYAAARAAVLLAPASPLKMLPPPMTTATSMPSSTIFLMSRA